MHFVSQAIVLVNETKISNFNKYAGEKIRTILNNSHYDKGSATIRCECVEFFDFVCKSWCIRIVF